MFAFLYIIWIITVRTISIIIVVAVVSIQQMTVKHHPFLCWFVQFIICSALHSKSFFLFFLSYLFDRFNAFFSLAFLDLFSLKKIVPLFWIRWHLFWSISFLLPEFFLLWMYPLLGTTRHFVHHIPTIPFAADTGTDMMGHYPTPTVIPNCETSFNLK